MTDRRHLRLVAYGDDVDPPPPVSARVRRRDAALYARTVRDLTARGLHPAVAAIEAEHVVQRRHREDERKGRA